MARAQLRKIHYLHYHKIGLSREIMYNEIGEHISFNNVYYPQSQEKIHQSYAKLFAGGNDAITTFFIGGS